MKLTTKQKEAVKMLLAYEYLLFYGGARSGKTFCIVDFYVYVATKYPGVQLLMTRRYATDIRASLWNQTLPAVLKGHGYILGAEYTNNEKEMTTYFDNGSSIVCAGLDDAERVQKILGTEWGGIYINECHDIPWATADLLMSRLSQKIDGYKPRFIVDLNPTTTAHWCYKLWFLKIHPDSNKTLDEDYSSLFASLHMVPYDNQENLPENYIKTKLESMVGNRRTRFLDGVFSNDSELLVFRTTDKNIFEKKDFEAWAEAVGWYNVIVAGGLDLGYNDADGFAIIACADGSADVFIIYEHKERRAGVRDLAEAVKTGLDFTSKAYPKLNMKDISIYTDTGGGGKKIAHDLYTVYDIPVVTAYKRDKDMHVELLQDTINEGMLKMIKGSPFHSECPQIVWKRDSAGGVERKIDDDIFHPDMMDAVLYPMRYYYTYIFPSAR